MLLERFANGKSMDIIFDAANALIDDTNKDEELRELFKRMFGRYVVCPFTIVLVTSINMLDSGPS
jgi:hypothetical protein